MLNDEHIKLIIKSLDKDFIKQKQKYENAKEVIQKLCNHNELENIMSGRKCTICDKIFSYKNKELNKIVRKEYIEKNYYDKAIEICLEFIKKTKNNLSEESIKKFYNTIYDMKCKNDNTLKGDLD